MSTECKQALLVCPVPVPVVPLLPPVFPVPVPVPVPLLPHPLISATVPRHYSESFVFHAHEINRLSHH